MKNIQEMLFVGNYSFSNKEKTKDFFIIQALHNDNNADNKKILINVFTTKDIYDTVINSREIGDKINIGISINLSDNKIFYSIEN